MTGEFIEDMAGPTLIARIEGSDTVCRSGNADYQEMFATIATCILQNTDRLRYAGYLESLERYDEARELYEEIAVTGADRDRPWAFEALGRRIQADFKDYQGSIKAFRRAIAEKPDFTLAYANLVDAENELGQSGIELSDKIRLVDLLAGNSISDITPAEREQLQFEYSAELDDEKGNYQAAAKESARATELSASDEYLRNEYDDQAESLAAAHDAPAVRALLRNYREFRRIPEIDTLGAIAAHLELWNEAIAAGAVSVAQGHGPMTRVWYVHALLERGKKSDFAMAQSLIKGTPSDCYRCEIEYARTASAGNRNNVGNRFMAAIALAPQLPFAHLEWGKTLLKNRHEKDKKDLNSAIGHFWIAHHLSPRFPDPLEAWGEALVRAGDMQGAIEKFRQAATLAPSWANLQFHWSYALARAGRRKEAKNHRKLAEWLHYSECMLSNELAGTGLEVQGENLLSNATDAQELQAARQKLLGAKRYLPDSGRVSLLLGEVYKKIGSEKDATNEFKMAIARYSSFVRAELNPVEKLEISRMLASVSNRRPVPQKAAIDG